MNKIVSDLTKNSLLLVSVLLLTSCSTLTDILIQKVSTTKSESYEKETQVINEILWLACYKIDPDKSPYPWHFRVNFLENTIEEWRDGSNVFLNDPLNFYTSDAVKISNSFILFNQMGVTRTIKRTQIDRHTGEMKVGISDIIVEFSCSPIEIPTKF